MYRLYNFPGAGGFAVQALLEELGLPYELIHLDYDASEHKKAPYTDLNPLGQVPTLVLPDGGVMTESAAILLYLSDLERDAKLAPAPADPLRRDYLRWMMMLATSLYSASLRSYHPEDFTSADDPKPVSEVADRQLEELWQIIEDELAERGPWMLGEVYSTADIYAMMIAHWVPDMAANFAKRPNLKRLCDGVRARPAIARILPQHDDHW